MTATLNFVTVLRPDGSTDDVIHADSPSDASWSYDTLSTRLTAEGKEGYRNELRDRFGIRAARTI